MTPSAPAPTTTSSKRDAVPLCERGPQRADAAVRVAVQLARGALDRLERRRERRERPLVRGELDDAVEPELALHLLDRLSRLVRDEIRDRAAEEPVTSLTRLVAGRARFLRQNSSPPAIPASAAAIARDPAVRASGTAAATFSFATRFLILRTTQPTTAFRLLTMPMSTSLGLEVTLPDARMLENEEAAPAALDGSFDEKSPPGPAGGMAPEDRDEGTS